ncbi:MAG: LCP family protein [Clostridia bacterium]|nr:LCP family protein [Clostridia bacterium]
MKIKIALFLALAIIAGLVLYGGTPIVMQPAAEEVLPLQKSILVLGIDHAASNSDVVMLAHFSQAEKQLVCMQLPRDMYIEGEREPKLNHIFASCRAKGMTEADSLSYTAKRLSDAFSIPIDGAICIDLAAFSRMVDAVGGIPITVPMDMTYHDPAQGLSILLKQGKTVLDGNMAQQFVRYRSGYLEGDIGRLDAQKLFLAAAFQHLSKGISLSQAVSLSIRFLDDVTLVGSKSSYFSLVTALLQQREALRVSFLSIPGEALQEHEGGGTWYYVINRPATCAALNKFFTPYATMHEGTFDAAGLFCKNDERFLNIHLSTDIPYQVYGPEDISHIKITKKDN